MSKSCQFRSEGLALALITANKRMNDKPVIHPSGASFPHPWDKRMIWRAAGDGARRVHERGRLCRTIFNARVALAESHVGLAFSTTFDM
ncbi:hypothetical protein CDAR_214321 [Caerostris darwini]|uniref:Uncharacterized protein n=1 Tax=Caerostris darwini TaxID=1538125 RepID=A0AAV4S5V1_9ARAC|nr:hypothetical protein CDAR_214321 [Caerostris darwini]